MGFFQTLFGTKRTEELPVVETAAETVAEPIGPDGIPPEVIAAIGACINITMEEADAELVAAMTAAIVHARGGGLALRFRRTNNVWMTTGRQKVMDSRL